MTDPNDHTPTEARLLAAEKRVGELEDVLVVVAEAFNYCDERNAEQVTEAALKWAALANGDEAK